MNYLFLITPIITFLFIQLFKGLIDLTRDRFSWRNTLHYGGMPSSHTGTVVALVTIIALIEGITSVSLAIVLTFGTMVIIDAIGIRRFLSDNAETLQELLEKNSRKNETLKTRFGHKPIEAIVGGIIGLCIALALYLIFA